MVFSEFKYWLDYSIDNGNHFGASQITHYDSLFIDLQSIITRKTRRLKDSIPVSLLKNGVTREELEKMVIDSIIKFIKKIINLLNDVNNIYIFMEGTVPLEKIQEKRKKAHLSDFLNSVYEEISQKNEQIVKFKESNNNVGTSFTKNLCSQIRNSISNNFFGEKQIFFSDYTEPHEVEHKIIKYIRSSHINNICIYSSNTNLIFLSFLIDKNIHIIEENCNYGSNALIYYEVNNFKSKVCSKLNKHNIQINQNDIIRDFVFLSFFLENTYTSMVPSIWINHGGFQTIEINYNLVLKKRKDTLIQGTKDDPTINNIFLIDFLTKLSKDEMKIIDKNLQKKHDKALKSKNGNKYGIDKLPDTEYYSIIKSQYRPINYSDPDSKDQYNVMYFRNNVEEACRNYLEGIIFCFNLYFKGITAWHWFKKYDKAPLASDLIDYLSNININTIILPEESPFTPLEQTMFIIPKKCFEQYALNFSQSVADRLNSQEFRLYYPTLEQIKRTVNAYEIETINYCRIKLPELNLLIFKEISDEFYNI